MREWAQVQAAAREQRGAVEGVPWRRDLGQVFRFWVKLGFTKLRWAGSPPAFLSGIVRRV